MIIKLFFTFYSLTLLDIPHDVLLSMSVHVQLLDVVEVDSTSSPICMEHVRMVSIVRLDLHDNLDHQKNMSIKRLQDFILGYTTEEKHLVYFASPFS